MISRQVVVAKKSSMTWGHRFDRWVRVHAEFAATVVAVFGLWAVAGVPPVAIVCAWVIYRGTRWGLWARARHHDLLSVGTPVASWWALGRVAWDETRRKRRLTRKWRYACQVQKLTAGAIVKDAPQLLAVKGTLDGDVTARIESGPMGVDPEDITAKLTKLAATIQCREIVLTPTEPGCADLTFYWTDPLAAILPIADLPAGGDGEIAYGVRRDGTVATIPWDKSTLIGGATGSGKSSCVWALLADLMRRKIPVELYVSDPKDGIELTALGMFVGQQMGTLKVVQYVDDDVKTAPMVEAACKAMRERRAVQRARGVRKITTPTAENPLVIVLLDELLPLQDMLKAGSKSALGKILYQGRSSLYVVWANSQLGQKETIGPNRDLFPVRVCFRTPNNATTDTVLQDGASASGALCSKLHETRDVGIGWSRAETSALDKFRGAWVRDDDITDIVEGRTPAGMTSHGSTGNTPTKIAAVYRVYDTYHHLLWIGASETPKRAMAAHAAGRTGLDWWAAEVNRSQTRTTWWPSLTDAEAEAARLIRELNPKHQPHLELVPALADDDDAVEAVAE